MASPIFSDRHDAGRRLAGALARYQRRADVIVLGLPRGGVPVAFEAAEALNLPLDVLLVRKIGAPGQPELAIGAIAAGAVRVLNDDIIAALGVTSEAIDQIAARESVELDRRDAAYRGGRARIDVRGKTVIVIDDGLATGSTMEAAVSALRAQGAPTIVVAAPVGARESCARLRRLADEVVCLETPEPFQAVGLWYRIFDQTSDDEVIDLLRRGRQAAGQNASADGGIRESSNTRR